MENKTGLIFGMGQDSSYLAEFLLEKNYKVIVIKRRSSSASTWRFKKALEHSNFKIVEGDVTDFASVLQTIKTYEPDEIYNLAAQSNVGTSFNQPLYTHRVCYEGVVNILESMRFLKSTARLYQASSSEMFGSSYDEKMFFYPFGEKVRMEKYQNENTKFIPQSPYAIAKLAAHNSIRLYRDAYGVWAVGGILFNHESPRRGTGFVTRKITKWFKDFISWKNDLDNPYKVKMNYDYKSSKDRIWTLRDKGWLFGPQYPKLQLGNIETFRDWGYAKEYVEAMWLMLQQDTPRDFVIGTGETHSIREFLQEVLNYYNISCSIDDFIIVDDNHKRPAEVPYLRADASLAERELGWKAKTTFKQLVELMLREENGLD